jgi:predicted transcriptional regulator of viral defense system
MIHARHEPIHVTVAARADDPRNPPADIPGVVIHHAPELHPDDVTVVDGIPVTSVARTLVDLAEVMDAGELRATFARARRMGLLDMEAMEASYARVEWRPSLRMLRAVMDEFRPS